MNIVKILVTIGTPLATGIGGFFIGKTVSDKKNQKRSTDEITQLTQYYEGKIRRIRDEHIEKKIEETKSESKEHTNIGGQVQSSAIPSVNSNPDLNTALNEVIKEYAPIDLHEVAPKPIRRKKGVKSETEDDVKEISLEQYQLSENDAESLMYYSNDVLVDGYGNKIKNPVDFIGVNGLQKCKFEMSSGNENHPDLYFSNTKLGIDFEVEFNDEVFDETD